ncbi:restriction endonuclease subunit S [Lactobacillus delbrueckii subsp. lactis]|uniref:restriction endonuclease subunit S n=1 Tax=Lactobacillus delbrueckii TaxID=1584 RepID=UPI001E3D2EB8|nr:restriction endonuclease subunit S [Lactobacillus delbrueckii]MCD5501294.1 restriction endonuclease subunit S [Lactobacillus delbrueckii subsp. lactis]
MKDKKKAPKLRFKGFTDDWEQRKLGDVADITTGSRNHQDSVTDGKYPFFVRSDKVERLNEYDFDTRAILVPGDGRIGEIFHYYNGKFALHQRVYKVDNFNGINALFLLGQFKYSFKKHALRLNAQGTVPSLRLPMFTNWNISIPNITEQERIGSFFRKLDQTITLHEEKKRQLERLKSALLQKMFANKNGYPAVRFEGFDKAWKQSKLGEITKVIAAKPYISTPSTHGNYLVIQQGDKPIAGFSNSNPFKNYNNITLFGDHTLSLFKPRSPFLVASDGIKILSPSIEMNGLFYFYELEKYKPKSEGYKRHFTILKKCKANFPTDIDEQKLIGSLLLRIDNLITKQQLKMDKLNETKESLLQNMFI